MGRKSREEVIIGQIVELNKELKEVKRNKRWTCAACQKKTRVRDLTLQDVQFYVAPYGCSAGYQHKHGHYEIECPKCGAVERIHEDHYNPGSNSYVGTTPVKKDTDEHAWVHSHSIYFASTEKVYPK